VPGKRTHDVGVMVAASAWIGVSVYYQFSLLLTFGVLLGILLDVFLTPDLDLKEADQKKDIWDKFWMVYGLRFKHRGISHFPVIGMITRVFYIPYRIGQLFCGLLALGGFLYLVVLEWWPLPKFVWFVLGGLIIGDVVHLFMDLFSTGRKVQIRKFREWWGN
jgi:uncharacterized metal-binding protein